MKLKKNFSLLLETDYEIRRLAKAWNVSISCAWERCCHYAAACVEQNRLDIYDAANVRQAEAKVEMLKGNRKRSYHE